ncbi:MAG TPA: BatA domain-containing protein [Planctomycetota bacterium]|nr:BatA domain-containing protein [Planctomycetota bacterium]
MGFLAPLMLAGLAAASVPIILHFFFRSRYRTVPWAAMKFLLTSIEQVSRRLRFQELLLLVVRTLLLAFLAFALARPTSSARGAGAQGDAVDAVLLFDVSASLDARDGPGTRLDRAKAAAKAVVDNLPAHSTVQVIAAGERATLLGPVAASNLQAAREVIQAVELSHGAGDLLPGAEEIATALARGHSPNKELWVFSDHQKRAWEAQGTALAAKLRDVARQASVHLVRCGTRAPRNVAVVGIAPQSGLPHVGDRIGFAVLLRNSGAEAARDLTVTLQIDGQADQKESQPVSVLAPGETLAVTLTARFDKPGLRTIRAEVSSDELDADNRLSKIVQVHDQARVLVVDGQPSDLRPEQSGSFYLLHALRPVPESAWEAYPIQPRAVSPTEASPALLGEADLCILVNCPVQAPGDNSPAALSSDFVERLAGFVKEGRGLVVFSGPRVSPELYNRTLLETHDLLPLRIATAKQAPSTAPLRLDPASIDVQSFLAPFKDEPLCRVDQTIVREWVGLDERSRDDGRVVLRYSNGEAAIAARQVGGGRVVHVTTSADQKWTDWSLRPTFLPFLHVALGHVLVGPSAVHNGTAGQPLRWRTPAAQAEKAHVLVDPAGRRVRLGAPERIDGLPVLALGTPSRAGVYRVAFDGSPEGVPFAVAPDPRETEDLETLSDAQIDERLQVKVRHYTAGDDLSLFSGAERLTREWTLWVLLAVLLLVLFETALAWYCGRGW